LVSNVRETWFIVVFIHHCGYIKPGFLF